MVSNVALRSEESVGLLTRTLVQKMSEHSTVNAGLNLMSGMYRPEQLARKNPMNPHLGRGALTKQYLGMQMRKVIEV